jgi:alkylation response protein AidB-like acyl-CoA dehydrogenase
VSAVAIDFTLSDSQQELQKNAKAFAEGVLRPVAGLIDRADDGWESFLVGREAYREMAHAGFTKSFIPRPPRRGNPPRALRRGPGARR